MSKQDAAIEPVDEEPTAADGKARTPAGPGLVGSRVREERLRQQVGVRELARRVGVSASLVSQVELGKASPSVGTLYAIVSELGLSLDELFSDSPSHSPEPGDGRGDNGLTAVQADPAGPRPQTGPIVHRGTGKTIQLATGVRWERLTTDAPQDVDFLSVTYPPGSESCPPDSLMRHSGREYGHVVAGRLGVTIGFETYELGAGDSVSFDSSEPHRLFTVGAEPVRAIWFVVGRRGDPRVLRER